MLYWLHQFGKVSLGILFDSHFSFSSIVSLLDLLTSPIGLIHSLTANKSLYLAAWEILGNPQKQILFQKKLPLWRLGVAYKSA